VLSFFGFLLRGFRFGLVGGNDSGGDEFGEDWGWEEVPAEGTALTFDAFFVAFFDGFTEIFPIASAFETKRHRVLPSLSLIFL
jgi:hypothetical protein